MSAIHTMGFDEVLVGRALAQAGGNEELAINLLLNDALGGPEAPSTARAPLDPAQRSQPTPGIRQSSLPLSMKSDSQRYFVVMHPEVELSNKADVFVHGFPADYQAHSTSGALFPNGSDMWLGKFELGVPAIVHRIDRQLGQAFAQMQGFYKGCSCVFEGKDLICFKFDEIYVGREVFVVPPKDIEYQLSHNACVAVYSVTLFPKSWVSGLLQKPTVPPGCIALPRWLRRSLFLSDDLIGHRLTLNYVQVHELPVANSITLRCVSKDPPTLPDFCGRDADMSLSLSTQHVILQEHMQTRNLKALTVGLRFSVFYCSKNDGGCWDLEVCSIKARFNRCGDRPIDEENFLPAGLSGCVFSNCENSGTNSYAYELLPDESVSSSPVRTHSPCRDLNSGDTYDFERRYPPILLSDAPDSVSPLSPSLVQDFQNAFGSSPEAAAFAPGCLEFLGNHLDYNGGPVHGVAINKGVTACVALERHSLQAPRIRVRNSHPAHLIGDGAEDGAEVSVFFNDLHVQADSESRTIPEWAIHTVGILHTMRSQGMQTPHGCTIYLHSTPDVAVDFSASVEIAVAVALAKIYNWTDYNLSHATTKEHEFQVRVKLVQLCQKARIGFVGAPSGVDHAFSVFSEEGRVVRLICSVSPIAVSFCDVGNEGCANLKLNMWVFASGYCHELADSLYKTRIQECKAAAAFLGLQSLSDCSLDHLESSRLALTEAQYSRAKHVIEETHRVHDCVEYLRRGNLAAVGLCLSASHRSSKLLFQNSCDESDFLVEELSKSHKVFGARMTGKGWGGTCLALADDSFTESDAELVAQAYSRRFQTRCNYFTVSAAQAASVYSL